MWFVILALLIVAAYFVYDAFRDKRLADSGSSMSTAQRLPSTATTDTAANYKSVNTAIATDTSSHPDVAANDTSSSATAGNKAAGAAIVAGMSASAVATRKSQASSGKLQFLESPIGTKDDLTRIDGIGPIIEGELNTLGIYHYHQIGNFSDSDVESVNAELDFPGRIERELWIAQARNLMTDSSAVGAGGSQTGGSAAATTAAAPLGLAGAAAVAGGVAVAGAGTSSSEDNDDDDFSLSDADLTGAWNTDVMIEVQERLKVLNTRESDAPRLNISREDYRALKEDDDERFSRDELLKILDRLRVLET